VRLRVSPMEVGETRHAVLLDVSALQAANPQLGDQEARGRVRQEAGGGVTRLEAAEKEVVRAAMESFVLGPHYISGNLSDACARLRDLRERAKEEECGTACVTRCYSGPTLTGGSVTDHDRVARCHLPRGHEGEHQGELGLWRWE